MASSKAITQAEFAEFFTDTVVKTVEHVPNKKPARGKAAPWWRTFEKKKRYNGGKQSRYAEPPKN